MFRCPCNHFRLDDIACDAELQEKSESELKKIAETLKSGCEQAIKDFNNKQAEDTPNDGKIRLIKRKVAYSILIANQEVTDSIPWVRHNFCLDLVMNIFLKTILLPLSTGKEPSRNSVANRTDST